MAIVKGHFIFCSRAWCLQHHRFLSHEDSSSVHTSILVTKGTVLFRFLMGLPQNWQCALWVYPTNLMDAWAILELKSCLASEHRNYQPSKDLNCFVKHDWKWCSTRTLLLLGHSMGTLRLYELLHEVQKLIGGSGGILPQILQPPRSVLRPYTIVKCKSLMANSRMMSVLDSIVIRCYI